MQSTPAEQRYGTHLGPEPWALGPQPNKESEPLRTTKMRPDFHQVLIERPRGGLRIKRQPLPRLRVADWDGEDFVEPALPRARRTKYFDDLIGPLRKWLRKQVNRPWDKVYSELCATIDRRTTVGEHLLDHVRMEVTVRCERDADGRLINIESRWRNEVEGLYVDPKSGILRWKAQISRRQYQQQVRRQQRERLRDVRKLADDRLLQRIDGIWFELVVSQIYLSRYLSETKLKSTLANMNKPFVSNPYGHFEVINKHQLNRRELRQHGLSNR